MFSCFSCISSTKAVITNDISNIEQSTPIIEKDTPIVDVSNSQCRTILYYFKILKEPEPVSTTRLEDSKSENKASDSDEEICLILQDKPDVCIPPRIITPIQDETREIKKTHIPNLEVQ